MAECNNEPREWLTVKKGGNEIKYNHLKRMEGGEKGEREI